MSENISHYNVEQQTPEIQQLVAECHLSGPTFIGQGLSKRVGSDSYGYYIVAQRHFGKTCIWGIAHARQVMHGHWAEGDEDCSIDMATAKPVEWITSYGKWKRTGRPKWWYCDEEGFRKKGQHACFGWNGAYAYRDPSF